MGKLLIVLLLPLITGCAKYYYHHPDKLWLGFDDDGRACIREVGIPSGGGQYALVTREAFQRCMQARGWRREKKVEPVELGWYRGVEGDDVVSLEAGLPQPVQDRAANAPSRRTLCRQTHLFAQDWRANMAAYQECLRQ